MWVPGFASFPLILPVVCSVWVAGKAELPHWSLLKSACITAEAEAHNPHRPEYGHNPKMS